MIYAFVPARGDSTRMKDKNIQDLGGKPLLMWSLEAAEQSEKVDKIIFSSDSAQYIEIVREMTVSFTKEVLIDNRPKAHAQTKSKIFDYLKGDLLHNFPFTDEDMLVQLLPTGPFRNGKHIDKAIELAQEKNCGVFAVCTYDFHVSFALEPKGNNEWAPLFPDSPLITGNTQSQSQIHYLHPNGSINCLPIPLLRQGKSSIYEGCCYYEMSPLVSLDIDDRADLELAAKIIGNVQ